MREGRSGSLLARLSGGRWGRRLVAEANAARDAGEWNEAAELYRLAHRRKPRLRYLQDERAAVLWQAGRLEEARDLLVQHLRAASGTDAAEAESTLGEFWAATGNTAAAAFHFVRAAAAGRPAGLFSFRDGRVPVRFGGRARLERAHPDGILAALAACEREPVNVEAIRRVADRLAAAGSTREAAVMGELAGLRAGSGRRDGAAPRAAGVPPILAGAHRDVSTLLAVVREEPPLPDDPSAFFLLPPTAPGGTAGIVTSDTFALIERHLARLRRSLADGGTTELRALLGELRTGILDAPPLACLGTDASDLPRLVARTAWNGLRDLLIRTRYLAYPPSGSAELFQASAGFGRSGFGPFLESASRFLDTPADVFALIQLAWGRDVCPVATVERAAMLLGVHLGPAGTSDLVEELGDLGFTRAAAAIASQRFAVAARDPADAAIGTQRFSAPGQDRPLAGVLRDAFLIARRPDLARAAQARMVAAWPENRDERNVLGDMDRLVRHGMRDADRDQLDARFAQDARRARVRARQVDRSRRGLDFRQESTEYAALATTLSLVPELAIERPWNDPAGDGIELMHLGWFKRPSPWGSLPVLRGIEAVRLAFISPNQAVRCEVAVDGRSVAELSRTEPAAVDAGGRRRVVFNAWIDLSVEEPGSHLLTISVTDSAGNRTEHRERILVDGPVPEDRFSMSDATVVLDDPVEGGALESRINTLPSIVRPTDRTFFGEPPRRLLVVRADQLGDFVTSIPAVRRLRELLPEAEISALVTPGNADLARSLGLFARVFTVDLAYSHVTKRRHLSIDEQEALQERLASERFDLAIDLSPGSDSRPLLRLSGAPNLVGFKPAEFPWLTLGIDARTHDRINGKERASHATHVLTLVDALGAALTHRSIVVRNPDADRGRLTRFGIGADDRFVVLHSGARIDFKRWPFGHYLALARLIAERTDRKVVLLADDGRQAGLVADFGISKDRLCFVGGMVAVPELEALLAFCDAFVGNDTGPKHLAALRGAKVVSVHMGQVNWDEWGQEGEGLIVSRRVPCCGCGIDRIENCGKDLACLVNITPGEVFGAVMRVAGL